MTSYAYDTAHQSALLTFMRHGEKNAAGELTTNGHYQAKKRGVQTKTLDGDIMLFHSGVGRVKDSVRDTVRVMAAHLRLDKETTDQLELGHHIVDYVAPGLQYFTDISNRGTYYSSWDGADNQSPERVNNRMRELLLLGSASPEPGLCYSPREMAQHLAVMIGIEVRFANMTDISHRVNFVNGSHEPVLMSFLHYFLHDFNPKGCDTVGEVGGSIEFAESFEVGVYHTSDSDFYVELKFRDLVKIVDLVKLREFGYS